MAIGEVVTMAQLKSLQLYNEKELSKVYYIAPTVFRPANGVGGWNYYKSAADVVRKYAFVNRWAGATDVAPAGSVSFKTAAATTFGINVDFFFVDSMFGMGVLAAPFTAVKDLMYGPKRQLVTGIIRFFKTDGSGPFYAILDNRYLSVSATTIDKVPAAKAEAIEKLHRSVQLIKYKYNALAAFVLELSKKKKNATEQQVFDESLVVLLNFEKEIRGLKGVDITWGKNGKISGTGIGLAPIYWIAIIAVSAIVATYAIDGVLAYLKDAKIIEESNDTVQFVNEQRLKIAEAVRAGKITDAQAKELNNALNNTEANATKNITDITNKKDETIVDKLTTMLMWGGGIYLASKFLRNG